MTIKSVKWVRRFIALADMISGWSKDPSTKTGAVIVDGNKIISVGFNGFPAGTEDSEEIYNDRDRKLARVIHAELNAILCAKTDLTGKTMVCTHVPCCQCAAAIVQSGIKEVIVPTQDDEFVSRWVRPILETIRLFEESDVSLREYTYWNTQENDMIIPFELNHYLENKR